MNIFVIILEIYSAESATVNFSIIIIILIRTYFAVWHKFCTILLMKYIFYMNDLITKY